MIIPGIHSFYANQLGTMFTKRSSSNLLSNHHHSEYTRMFPFYVMNCINNHQKKRSANTLCQSPFYFSFLNPQPTSKQQAMLYLDGVTSAHIFALIAKIISPPGRKSVEKIGLLDAIASCSIKSLKKEKKGLRF